MLFAANDYGTTILIAGAVGTAMGLIGYLVRRHRRGSEGGTAA
jgi:hypothetical protein